MSTSKLGLGLAALGRPEYINIRKDELKKTEDAFRANAMQVINKAYDLGIRYFDSAPSYGKGEEFLKDWIQVFKKEDAELATKWGYTYEANWELGFQGIHEVKEHSIEKLIEQWEQSKALLPRLKVYQIHSATIESGVLKNQEVLNKLAEIKKETGLLIGLTTSGVNQSEVIEIAKNVEVNGAPLFDAYQVTYNILDQSAFKAIEQLLADGKKVIVKEALANGRVFKNEDYPDYMDKYNFIDFLAAKYDVGVDAVALRFVYDSLSPSIVLSGAVTEEQLEQNLKVNSFELSAIEIKLLKGLVVDVHDYWSDRKELSWS
ncbi:aldo/keto reductase [Flavobacteriaceae bacterium]|nr:aldo/keto reductase [Flavobacteriaceae bacterium]